MKKTILTRMIACIITVCMLTCMAGCGDEDKTADQAQPQETAAVEDKEADKKDEPSDNADTTESEKADTAEAEEQYDGTTELESDAIGITYYLPEVFFDTEGQVSYLDFELEYEEEAFIGEMDYTGVATDEINKMIDRGMTDSEGEYISDNTVPLFIVMAIVNNKPVTDLVDYINSELEMDVAESDLKLLAKVDDCSFYSYEEFDADNYDNLSDDAKAEYYDLAVCVEDVLKNAKYTRPGTPSDELIGKKISFTTKDLNGNTVNSDELFAQHDITMINVWATWCGYCVDELPDLEVLNRSLASKNCAIVGFCGDADSKDQIALAKSILKKSGVTYLNLCTFDGWKDVFDMEKGWPTSIFVDKSGTIITAPVYGARIKDYEMRIDDALKGKVTDKASVTNSYENSDNCYSIRVVDQNLNPVVGATVQYCTKIMCKMAVTDKDGSITFNDPPEEYEIHVLRVPEGYNENTNSYKTKPKYSNMVIVVEKE